MPAEKATPEQHQLDEVMERSPLVARRAGRLAEFSDESGEYDAAPGRRKRVATSSDFDAEPAYTRGTVAPDSRRCFTVRSMRI